jgi:hypothetical protein
MSSTTLATCADTSAPRATYMVALARHPTSVVALSTSLATAISVAGTFAALPLLAMFAATTWLAAGCSSIRRALETAERRRQISIRRDRREARLESAGVSRAGMAEATFLVDSITSSNPDAIERLELEDLLDRYADAAIAHARCGVVLISNDRGSLLRALDVAIRRREAGDLRRQILERRLAYTERCREQAAELDQQLACITELLRLLAQRTAMTGFPPPLDEDPIAERLARIDAEDSL